MSGFAFGSEWDFQAMWHNTSTDTCNGGATNTTSTDWFDPCCWSFNPNQPVDCVGIKYPGWIMWAAMESKGDCAVLNTSPLWPGTDSNGYDAYCGQLTIMPWSWEYASSQIFTVDSNMNCGAFIGLGSLNAYPGTWGAPVLDVNGGTMTAPGLRNFDPNDPYDPCLIPDPNYLWVVSRGLWVGGGSGGGGENYGFVNIRNTGKMIVPRIRIYNGEVNLFPDGLLYDTNSDPAYFFISQARALSRINIAGGELRLAGDRRDQVAYYVSKSRIVACEKHGALYVDYNGVDTSVIAICTPNAAWNPTPVDGATGVPLVTTLKWEAGPYAQDSGLTTGKHAVYFGLSQADVCNATPGTPLGVYKGRQDPCTYAPSALVMDTNYFWRIDEYNDACSAVYKGNIWKFKSKGPQASDPIPADGAVGIPIPIVLKWNPGAKASGTSAHAVFFGPNETNVTDATVANPLDCYRGYVTSAVYDLSNLDFNLVPDTNYFWRIDESNGIDVWKGEVWNVRSTNYYVVEDFESYADNAAMLQKWAMGSSYTSCTFINANGVIEWDFNDGQGRMQYNYYDDSGERFSEVRFDVNNVNWNGGGALPDDNKLKSLEVSLVGAAGNATDSTYDRMYVAIQDTAGNVGMVVNPDPQAQRTFNWAQWYTKLSDLRSAGSPAVDINYIKYLYLGFGNRCAGDPFLGGRGRVRIDDIRLYQKACLPQFSSNTDLNGDCTVNITDLDVMAAAWLAKQTIISPVTNPGTAEANGCKLWYKFDETSGTTASDSSGHGYNGDVNCMPTLADSGKPDTAPWSAPGYDGTGACLNATAALIADNNIVVDISKSAISNSQTSITFSLWINGDIYMPLSGWARIICAFQDFNSLPPNSTDENEVLEIDCPVPRTGTGSQILFRAGVSGDSNTASASGMLLSAFAGSWQHYAFVRDGVNNKIRIYHNGEMIADGNALNPLFDSTKAFENFRLVKRNPGAESYMGKIDDFRIYNRALTQAEIGYLGTKGTGYVPFANVSNIKSTTPETVNFNDYALLAKDWLTEKTWP
jgi:hypothetical protein